MRITLKILFSLMLFPFCVVSVADYVYAGRERIIIFKPQRRMSDIRGDLRLRDSKDSILHRIVKHGSLEGLRIFLEETDVSNVKYDVESTIVATPYPTENPLINAIDAYGSPPLHYAAMDGKIGMTKMLIENGAWVDMPDNFGNTALHYAVYGDRFKTALILCEAHANVNLMNKTGKRPIDLADREDVPMINMLRLCAQQRG